MNGKVVLVTGASRGIGLETARDLLARGWRVGITARGAPALDAAAEALGRDGVLALPCDVAEPGAAEAAVARLGEAFGPVTALVNNAGVIDPVGPIDALDAEAFLKLLAINVAGVHACCRAVLPGMLAAGAGRIVNLSSGAAHNPVEGWAAYCTSKAALAMYTRCLHAEYGARGIRVNGFVPGVVGTDLLHGAQKAHDNAIARLDPSAELTPDVPARCVGWIVDADDGVDGGAELSIRDADLRAKVGLEDRATW